jgi:hypothetical protein
MSITISQTTTRTMMAALTPQIRPAERVRKVAELALEDAVEITLLIGLMEGQNTGGVNTQLNEAGAARSAMVVRNALLSRLVWRQDQV